MYSYTEPQNKLWDASTVSTVPCIYIQVNSAAKINIHMWLATPTNFWRMLLSCTNQFLSTRQFFSYVFIISKATVLFSLVLVYSVLQCSHV